MNFTIENKNNYSLFKLCTPIFDESVVDDLKKVVNFEENNSVNNMIIDLSAADNMKGNISASLIALHKDMYDANASLVFTNFKEDVWQVMKQNQLHLILNTTPTMQEAIDIISMEVLERDLLDEGA